MLPNLADQIEQAEEEDTVMAGVYPEFRDFALAHVHVRGTTSLIAADGAPTSSPRKGTGQHTRVSRPPSGLV